MIVKQIVELDISNKINNLVPNASLIVINVLMKQYVQIVQKIFG